MKDTGPVLTALDAPTFAPAAGAVSAGTTVTITAGANQPADGQIYYTSDGTVPTPPSHGSLYVGPVQINVAETLIAVAHDPAGAFLDSPPASAIYTIVPQEAGTLGPVQFNPTAVAENNDFLVQLSDSAGATICYTLDGSAPACNASTGACTGTSKTYDAGSQVSINGTVTDVVQGTVKVQAIACAAGDTPSANASQNYQLTVADPQMTINGGVVPPGTGVQNVPWSAAAAGIQDTISTGTFNSITPVNAVALWYSMTGAPSCSTGNNVVSPTTLTQTTNGTTEVIGCKTGYHQSNVVSFPVTIQLNTPPILAGGTFHAEPHLWWAGVNKANAGIDDSANGSSGDVLCAGLNATPVCSTLPGGAASCTTGSSGLNTAAKALVVGNTTSSSTTVNIVACAPNGLNSSAQGTQTYVLQFAAGFAYTTQNLVAPATDLPGWDWNATGTPFTSMHIPATAVVTAPGYPYAGGGTGFFADVVQDLPCTGASTATGIPTSCTGVPIYQEPDYFCSSNTSTVATCGCAAGNQTAPGAELPAATAGVTATAGSNVLSVIPCQAAAGTGTPNSFVFAAPPATSITFSGANTALAPTVSAQVGAPQSVQATVTVTNNDTTTGGSQLCVNFGTGGSNVPADPTCTSGGCTTGEWCWVSAAAGWAVTTSTGTTAAGACMNVPTPATLPLGSNIVTISPGPQGGATGSPTGPGLVQKDGEQIKAVACNTVEATSSVSPTQTYAFKAAEPDFTSTAGEAKTPPAIGDMDTATSIGAGAVVNLSTTSNFDVDVAHGATSQMQIFWSTTGVATCGSPGVVNVTSVTQATATAPVISTWPTGAANGNPVAPNTGTTWTLSAVACGQNDGVLQQLSPPRTLTFQLSSAQPTFTTSQQVGASPACGASNSCAPVATWENAFTLQFNTTTTGNSICYNTNGSALSCTSGVCSGTPAANGATITVSASGTKVQAMGCVNGLTNSGTSAQTFTLNDDQAIVGQAALTCNGTTTIALSTLATDTGAGGPTNDACVCYTTNNANPSCPNGAGTGAGTAPLWDDCTSAAPDVNTTCFGSGPSGTAASGTITVANNQTINMVSCKTGFNPTSTTQKYTIAPYTHTIIVDGNLSDWSAANESIAASTYYWFGGTDATGYFTYDAANAYVGLNIEVAAQPDYYVGIYLGNGGATGATKEVGPLAIELGGVTRTIDTGLGITNAFIWPTDNHAAPGWYSWGASTLVWTAGSYPGTIGWAQAANSVEFGVPLSALGSPASVTMFGTHIQNVGYDETVQCGQYSPSNFLYGGGSGSICTEEDFESYRWPGPINSQIDYSHAFHASLASCNPPVNQIQ